VSKTVTDSNSAAKLLKIRYIGVMDLLSGTVFLISGTARVAPGYGLGCSTVRVFCSPVRKQRAAVPGIKSSLRTNRTWNQKDSGLTE
jgi:hypothetical protein